MLQDLFSLNGPYARAMNFLWNMLLISVLWILCCIPVITIGASCTAAYYAAAKCVRHQTGKVVSEFFSSFRSNFRQSACFTLIYGAVLAFLVIDCVYIYKDASIPLPVLYLFYFLVLITLADAIYLFACMSRFATGKFSLFRMSAVLMARHFISTILLLLLSAAVALAVYLMPWGLLVFPGLGIWLATFLMEPVLLEASPVPEPGSEEAQKWYYQ